MYKRKSGEETIRYWSKGKEDGKLMRLLSYRNEKWRKQRKGRKWKGKWGKIMCRRRKGDIKDVFKKGTRRKRRWEELKGECEKIGIKKKSKIDI